MKKIRTVREFEIRLSELDGKFSHSISSRNEEVVEEKDYRKMFLEAIACNCTPETFNKIEKDILLDDVLFQTYVIFKSSDKSVEEESQWMKNVIDGILQVTTLINKPEINMTTEQTTTPSSTETIKDNTMNKPEAQPTPAPEKTVPPVQPTTAPAAPTSVGINWSSVGKNVGIFVGGAVIGAASKWAWDHFVG